jgi:hypothetical protein
MLRRRSLRAARGPPRRAGAATDGAMQMRDRQPSSVAAQGGHDCIADLQPDARAHAMRISIVPGYQL